MACSSNKSSTLPSPCSNSSRSGHSTKRCKQWMHWCISTLWGISACPTATSIHCTTRWQRQSTSLWMKAAISRLRLCSRRFHRRTWGGPQKKCYMASRSKLASTIVSNLAKVATRWSIASEGKCSIVDRTRLDTQEYSRSLAARYRSIILYHLVGPRIDHLLTSHQRIMCHIQVIKLPCKLDLRELYKVQKERKARKNHRIEGRNLCWCNRIKSNNSSSPHALST